MSLNLFSCSIKIWIEIKSVFSNDSEFYCLYSCIFICSMSSVALQALSSFFHLICLHISTWIDPGFIISCMPCSALIWSSRYSMHFYCGNCCANSESLIHPSQSLYLQGYIMRFTVKPVNVTAWYSNWKVKKNKKNKNKLWLLSGSYGMQFIGISLLHCIIMKGSGTMPDGIMMQKQNVKVLARVDEGWHLQLAAFIPVTVQGE